MPTSRPGSGFTYADVLPTAGSAAPLLLAAYANEHSLPLAQLAKAAGISRFAAGRALPELLERGLLVEDVDSGQGWYAYDPSNPQHEFLADVAWRFSGVHRPSEDELRRHWSDDRYEIEQVQYRYGRLLPPSETIVETITSTGLSDGPNLVTARGFTDWAGRAGWRLRWFESFSQDVFAQWGNERFRDLVHQTLGLGLALARARRVVELAAGAQSQNGADPYQVPIPAQVWAQAMFLVSAEAAAVLDLVQLLEVAVSEGEQIHTSRDNALSELEAASETNGGQDMRQEHLRRAQDAAAAARDRWRNPPVQYAQIGGLPGPGDVGNGGDQLIAVQLLSNAVQLTRQVAVMAAHPSMGPHAAAAAVQGIELVTEIPTDTLQLVRRT